MKSSPGKATGTFKMLATILDIQRMSTEDGPGLRTTVFFKGCSLACQWCHNPESIKFGPQIQWQKHRCIGCRTCTSLCPQQALEFSPEGLKILREKCIACKSCVEDCPAGAIECKGEEMDTRRLLEILLRDKEYFGQEGGVTLSGGEAILQPAAVELLQRLQESGIITALDTAGHVATDTLLAALPYCNLLLYDVKIMDRGEHEKFTGQGNELVLKNLKAVAQYTRNHPLRLWIRTPIIPGATDTIENLTAIGEFLREIDGIERHELCAFNNLCRDKYRRLDLNWQFAEAELIPTAHMQALWQACKEASGLQETYFTGALRREE